MRALPIAVFFLLSACAPTLDDLIVEANSSGDFTAVNARLEIDDKAQAGPTECGSHFILLCESSSHGEACGCAPSADFHDKQRELAVRRRNKRRY